MAMLRVLFGVSYRVLSFLLLFSLTCCAKKNEYFCQNTTSCGDLKNISYPFRLEGSRDGCGDPNYLLACENNRTILNLSFGKYFVREINRTAQTIRVVDAALQQSNCSSLPQNLFTTYPYYDYYDMFGQSAVTFMNCESSDLSVNSSHFVGTWPCVSGTPPSKYSYVMLGDAKVSEMPRCLKVSEVSCREKNNCSYLDVYDGLLNGFQLSWSLILCKRCEGRGYCLFNDDYSELLACSYDNISFTIYYWIFDDADIYGRILNVLILLLMAAGARCVCGTPCVLAFIAYKWRRRHLSMYDNIETFLRSHNNLMPIMYSYFEIKKMTRGFRDKLGEGGYGSVYRGKLSSGRAVAIKVLGKPKASGQEFINEVATIGRIHHVNVVQLIGFCAERKKRALVYDFMPNGSLEKLIFSSDAEVPLSYEYLYKISTGIARGIEYLHKGCDMQILHFDIKPHNILLDENFTAKVSDFGLAKLYPTEDSIVSLTAPRGTMGYMAPELFYKNIGGVSYKADVYSFGMSLMEMAGRRKNLNAFAEHSSQIYFPSWVYNQISEGGDFEMESATEEEREIIKKMLIVALWCIQMKPSYRPSMSRVVEMLEGQVESLQMPPEPFQSPQQIRKL